MASRGCRNETRRRLVKRVETLDQKVGLDYSACSEKTAVERMLIDDDFWNVVLRKGANRRLSER
jgi:hypothetical protein